MKRVSVIVILCCLSMLYVHEAKAQTPDWPYTSTAITHEFYFSATMIICSTDFLDIGDYVGIFYDSLGITEACAGYMVWNGGNQSLLAHGDDTLTAAKEGFFVGDSVRWKTFHVNDTAINSHIAFYAHDSYYVDSNLFVVNGGSALTYLGNCVEPVFQDFSESAFCNGSTDGSAWIDIFVINPPYTAEWSDGSWGDTILNKPAGTYTVTVTNINGFTTAKSIVIDEPGPLTLQHSCQPYSQLGFPNGSISVSVTGGIPPYFYSWNNGGTSQYLANLYPGNYVVSVSDAHLCLQVDTVEVLTVIPDPWTVYSTPVQHEINFTEHTTVSFNGDYIKNGDVIAVFYDSLGVSRCAGKFQYNDGFGPEGTILLAYGDDPNTFPDKEGFYQGNVFSWKIWDASQAQEYDVVASYIDTVIWPEHGFFATGGKSGVKLLSDTEHDMGISAWISPTDYCGLSSSDTIKLEVFSEGMSPVDWFYLKYNINGGPWISDSIVQPMNFHDTLQIALLVPANLETPIDYHLRAVVELLGDSNPDNDSIDLFLSPIQIASVAIPDTTGNCVGQAIVSINGGTPPYSVVWNDPNNQVGGTAISLCTGMYLVQVTDDKECEVSEEVIVENTLPPTFFAYTENVSCYGEHDGSIDLSMIDFILPVSYSWSNGAISQDLTNVVPGTYIVTITDGTSLSVTDTFTITEPDSLALSYTSEDILCFGDETGSIDLEVSGGTLPYFYIWSNWSLQADIDQLPGGNYIVTVIDGNSCTVTQYVYIAQPPNLVVNFIVSDISTASAGDGSIFLSMFGATPPYTFLWSTGATKQNLSMLEQGYYSLTVNDAANCESTFDSIFIFEPYPVVSGLVFMGPNPSPDGVVLLFEEFPDQHIEAIDYTFVSNGYYSFSVPPGGKYLIYALPNPDYGFNVYPLYFPTYFGADIRWAFSTRIETVTDYANTDIYLSSYEGIFYGPASISGNLSYLDTSVYEEDIFNNQWFNNPLFPKSSGENPARNIPILLLNENYQPVMFKLTDEDGNFNMKNVEFGEYILRAEKAGYFSEEVPISLSADHSTVSDIKLFIQPSEIVIGIGENPFSGSQPLFVYPNPVDDYMVVQLPSSGLKIEEISIYSVDGKKIITLSGNEIQSKSILGIETNKLAPGVYFLEVETKDNIKLKNKFIKI